MHPPTTSRRGPLFVLTLAFIALLVLPVALATVGADADHEAASAAGTTTEVPTTAGATTTSQPDTTTTEAAPTTTEAPVVETTTSTIDLAAASDYAAAVERSKVTTTTAPPAPEPEIEYVYEPVVEVAATPQPVYEAPAPTYGGDAFAGLSAADRDFLACVRNRESGGDYTVVNPSSGAGGAYQFLLPTWNNTASHAGRGDLVGTYPQYASAYDQDFLAAHLLQWYGRSPWSYSCS